MPFLFEYYDYRKYLSDCYKEKKAINQAFSFTFFSKMAKFANKGFIHNVIHGTKNLSKQSVLKLSNALHHTKSEADYFENLVFFNQAIEREERNHYYENLVSVRSRNPKAVAKIQLTTDQYEYYSEWYHSAVRSIIGMTRFTGDYAQLAQSVYPAILPKQAKKSVALLLKLGLVRKGKNGVYELSQAHITTGEEILDLAVLNFHRKATELAGAAMDNLPKGQRNITGITLGTSRKAYEEIREAEREFRQRVVDIVDKDKDKADRVYRLNIHLFPMSRPLDISGQRT
jgi:uncharacterized protein (TIGR02147 family)